MELATVGISECGARIVQKNVQCLAIVIDFGFVQFYELSVLPR